MTNNAIWLYIIWQDRAAWLLAQNEASDDLGPSKEDFYLSFNLPPLMINNL